MATSAILSPSAYDFARSFNPSKQSQQMPAPPTMNRQPRPKLSLNTTTPSTKRSFGKGNTALRLDTLSATTSPTTRNTYKNTYNAEQQEAQRSNEGSHAPLTQKVLETDVLSTSPTSLEVEPRVTGARTKAPQLNEAPYRLADGVRSILVNGPLHKRMRAPTTPIVDRLSTGTAASPTAKKVCFCSPLAEEIRNERYLMKHSDLRSRSSSPLLSSSGASGQNAKPKTPAPRLREMAVPRQSQDQLSGSTDADGESGTVDDADAEAEDETVSKTPVAGRHKKQREWSWTLGPVPGVVAKDTDARETTSPTSPEEALSASLGESMAGSRS